MTMTRLTILLLIMALGAGCASNEPERYYAPDKAWSTVPPSSENTSSSASSVPQNTDKPIYDVKAGQKRMTQEFLKKAEEKREWKKKHVKEMTHEEAMTEIKYAEKLNEMGMPDLAERVIEVIPKHGDTIHEDGIKFMEHPLPFTNNYEQIILKKAGTNDMLRLQYTMKYANSLIVRGETNVGFRIYREIDAELNGMLEEKPSPPQALPGKEGE